MEVSVRGRHVDMSEPFRMYAGRRVQFAVGAFERRIDHADVRIEDINGPRGGIDKSCAVTVTLKGGGSVRARSASGDAYAAVDLAAGRIRSALARRLGMRDERRRSYSVTHLSRRLA